MNKGDTFLHAIHNQLDKNLNFITSSDTPEHAQHTTAQCSKYPVLYSTKVTCCATSGVELMLTTHQ